MNERKSVLVCTRMALGFPCGPHGGLRGTVRLFLMIPVLAALAATALPGADTSVADSNAESEVNPALEATQCRHNLERIRAAIEAYRADKKHLPDWLSDLVPQYLDDVNLLTCPVTRRTGQVNNYGLPDPKLPTSYLYEFCNVQIPKSIYGGSQHTMREWKERQVALVGEVVPMVRCHQHSPQISLALNGTIFESTNTWESMFSNRVSAEALSLQRIFPSEAPPGVSRPAQSSLQSPVIVRIPSRDSQAPSSLVDLTDYYNAGLNEGWHAVGSGSDTVASDLAWLPKGIQTFTGTQFDVRGIIQLAGLSLNNRRYPPAVKGIRVNRKCSTLSFLHGTGWFVADGTQIGHYRVVYSGGEERQVPIVYGVDVRDWYMGTEPKSASETANSTVAWMGKSPATQAQGVTLRLFKTTWQNPLANLKIETLDYVSALTNCAPFLVAVTAE